MAEKRGCFGSCMSMMALGFLAVLVLLILVAVRTPKPPPSSPSAPVTQPGPPSRFKIGDAVIINRPGGAGHAHLCVDKGAYDKLQESLATKNLGAFSRMVHEEQRIVIVPNDSPGSIVKITAGIPMVEVTDGTRKGAVGYVDPQYLMPAGSQ